MDSNGENFLWIYVLSVSSDLTHPIDPADLSPPLREMEEGTGVTETRLGGKRHRIFSPIEKITKFHQNLD